jgi:hypothetical protein
MKYLIFPILAALLAGCDAPPPSGPEVEPFQVKFDGRSKWTDGHSGFEPSLPGYFITGEIASIVLSPQSTRMPNKMVLAITTSPGMRPMLEGFEVTTNDVILNSALFNGTGNTWVTNRDTGTHVEVKRGEYFEFRVVGKAVHVTFLPKLMALLKGDITISWVDWYRE